MNIKKSLFAVILVTVFLSFSYTQNVSVSDNTNVSATVNSSNNTVVDGQSFENSTNYFGNNGGVSTDGNSALTVKKTSTVWTIIKVLFFLIIVCVAIYFVMRFFKKKSNITKSDDDFMRRVSTLMIGPGKSIEIITLLDKAYLVGVTEGNISLLSEITDKELIEALNINFDQKQNVTKPMNFDDVLSMFTGSFNNKKNKSETNLNSNSANKKGSGFGNIYNDLVSKVSNPFKESKNEKITESEKEEQ